MEFLSVCDGYLHGKIRIACLKKMYRLLIGKISCIAFHIKCRSKPLGSHLSCSLHIFYIKYLSGSYPAVKQGLISKFPGGLMRELKYEGLILQLFKITPCPVVAGQHDRLFAGWMWGGQGYYELVFIYGYKL